MFLQAPIPPSFNRSKQMPTAETLERFIARVEENAHAEACEEFYTANSAMRENQSQPRVRQALYGGRNQTPPGPKVAWRTFERERRYPINAAYCDVATPNLNKRTAAAASRRWVR
jgi:hypothetical protein